MGHQEQVATRSEGRRHSVLIVCASGSMIVVVALCAFVFSAGFAENTLHSNGRWSVSKLKLKTYMMGAESFYRQPDALASGQLHLDAWYGYQEVLYTDKLALKEVSFDFAIGRNTYLVFVYNGDEEGACGIRLSLLDSKPSAYLNWRGSGEFIQKTSFSDPPKILDNARNHCAIRWNGATAVVSVNGAAYTVDASEPRNPAQVGFRGGSFTGVTVDEVAFGETSGRTTVENFEPPAAAHVALRVVKGAAAVAGAQLLLLLGLRRLSRNWPAAFRLTTVVNATLLLCALVLLLSPSTTPFALYIPNAPPDKQEALPDSLLMEQLPAIHSACKAPCLPDTKRIFFLGTSQTAGDGARVQEECYVSLLGKRLQQDAAQLGPVQAVNCGIGGSCSSQLFHMYEAHLVQYAPALVVVALGCNDSYEGRLPAYRENLRQLAELCQKHGSRVLFVLEPAAPDIMPNGWDEPGEIMRAVAAETGTPSIDGAECVKAKDDDGFLFWDIVHPTSYGHAVIADCLYPVIRQILLTCAKKPSAMPPGTG